MNRRAVHAAAVLLLHGVLLLAWLHAAGPGRRGAARPERVGLLYLSMPAEPRPMPAKAPSPAAPAPARAPPSPRPVAVPARGDGPATVATPQDVPGLLPDTVPATAPASAAPAPPASAPLRLELTRRELAGVLNRNPALANPSFNTEKRAGLERLTEALNQVMGPGPEQLEIEPMGQGAMRVRKGDACYEWLPTSLSRIDPVSHRDQMELRPCDPGRRR